MKPLKKIASKKKTYTTLLDLPFMGQVLKGFMVPNGYQLLINPVNGNGQSRVLNPGEYSGSSHSYQEVANGEVEGWTLSPLAQTSTPFEGQQKQLSADDLNFVAEFQSKYADLFHDHTPMEFLAGICDPKNSNDPEEFLSEEAMETINLDDIGSGLTILEQLRNGGLSRSVFDALTGIYSVYNAEPHDAVPSTPAAQVPAAKLKAPERPIAPLEIRTLNAKVKPTQEQMRIMQRKSAFLSKFGASDVDKLRQIYSAQGSADLHQYLSFKHADNIIDKVNSLPPEQPFSTRVALAVAELYPDSMFTQAPGRYSELENSTEILTQNDIAAVKAALPIHELREQIPDSVMTKGELVRFLGPNLVDDFGLFEPERDHTPAPKITDVLDVRQIPKYKIKGMSHEESMIQHIIDVVTPAALNLEDDDTHRDVGKYIDAHYAGKTNSLYNSTAPNAKGISATRYIHDAIMNYVASQPGCEHPGQIIYDWTTGKWGASSSTGFAVRFLEAEMLGRDPKDEVGYDKYIATNPAFEKEVLDKVERYRETYLALREVSSRVFEAAFPNGLEVHRGFLVDSAETGKEFGESNALRAASLACFSSSRSVADGFAQGEGYEPSAEIGKEIVVTGTAKSYNVAMLPSAAVVDDYCYTLQNGKSIKPNRDTNFNDFYAEREITLGNRELYPVSSMTSYMEVDEFTHRVNMQMEFS